MHRIERFRIEHLEKWLDFFDNRAFADNPGWGSCYCTFYHKPNEEREEGGRRPSNRDYARLLLESGRMRGYVALDGDGRVVGWCNVNERRNYQRLERDMGREADPSILSVVCFVIEKDHRGQGLSTEFLRRIIGDARAEGRSRVEAYPSRRATRESSNYHGYYGTYQKLGFAETQVGRRLVMRLDLQG